MLHGHIVVPLRRVPGIIALLRRDPLDLLAGSTFKDRILVGSSALKIRRTQVYLEWNSRSTIRFHKIVLRHSELNVLFSRKNVQVLVPTDVEISWTSLAEKMAAGDEAR